jgi:hypothetical protein
MSTRPQAGVPERWLQMQQERVVPAREEPRRRPPLLTNRKTSRVLAAPRAALAVLLLNQDECFLVQMKEDLHFSEGWGTFRQRRSGRREAGDGGRMGEQQRHFVSAVHGSGRAEKMTAKKSYSQISWHGNGFAHIPAATKHQLDLVHPAQADARWKKPI